MESEEKSTKELPKLRAKKCKNCKVSFVPIRPLQSVCSPGCAIERATKQRKTKERKEYHEAKEKQKSRGDYVRETQTVFNRYIRERDRGKPCISCGRMHQGQIHAGHYRATSVAPALRFHEENVHAQCQPCNCHKHGNLLEYRINLIQRIGLDRVEWLESPHEPAKYSIQDLKQLKAEYQAKLKGLK